MPKFRLSASGDVNIGPQSSLSARQYSLRTRERPTLVYGLPQPILVAGVAPRLDEYVTPPFAVPPLPPTLDDTLCFSCAPLENVTSAQIFNHVETRQCHGILLEYNNGGRRAVGQCRMGLDSFTETLKPNLFTYVDDIYEVPNTSAAFHGIRAAFFNGEGGDTETEARGWTKVPMKGSMRMWFNTSVTRLQIH